MCVLTLTKKDGTPFDVTSVQEEDIVEICVWLGCTHSLGVLCYTEVESIILFWSVDDMECAIWGAIKATVLCNEPIAVGATTLSEAHMRAYMTMVGGEEPHSPTDNPHLGGEILHHLQAELGDLTDHELHHLLEDLCREVALCELNALHRSPPQTPWGNPSGSRDPNVDHQECHLSKRGGWVLPGQPSPTPAPAQPDGGWVPQGPPPQPPTPAQPNADVGHLINTLTSGLH